MVLLLVGSLCVADGFLICWARRGTWKRWSLAGLVLVSAFVLQATVLVARVGNPVYMRFPYFPDFLTGWSELESRTGDRPTRIAYAGTNLPYYLLGRDFRNDVRYVNVDDHPDWLLHDYHRAAAGRLQPGVWPNTRPGWDRLAPDYRAWIANLDAGRVQFLVVTKADPSEGRFNCFDGEGFPVERTFADGHPGRFTRLHSDARFRLYAIRPPEKSPEGSTDHRARSH